MKWRFRRLEGCGTRNSEIPLIFRIHSCKNSRNLNSIKVFYETALKAPPSCTDFCFILYQHLHQLQAIIGWFQGSGLKGILHTLSLWIV